MSNALVAIKDITWDESGRWYSCSEATYVYADGLELKVYLTTPEMKRAVLELRIRKEYGVPAELLEELQSLTREVADNGQMADND